MPPGQPKESVQAKTALAMGGKVCVFLSHLLVSTASAFNGQVLTKCRQGVGQAFSHV